MSQIVSQLIYRDVGAEGIDKVRPLWEKLNAHHADLSPRFGSALRTRTFDTRKQKLLAKAGAGRLCVELVSKGRSDFRNPRYATRRSSLPIYFSGCISCRTGDKSAMDIAPATAWICSIRASNWSKGSVVCSNPTTPPCWSARSEKPLPTGIDPATLNALVGLQP